MSLFIGNEFKRPFAQLSQWGYSSADDKVKLSPFELLSADGHGCDIGEAECLCYGCDNSNFLAGSVDQGEVSLREKDGQRYARKATAGT